MSENKEQSNISKKYFIYLIIVLMFIEILDTYTTNYPNVIPSKVIEEFLYSFPLNIAESIFAVSVAIATLGMYFVFFNQLLADKFGRKILLGITVFGMGFASLLMIFSTSIVDYTIYLFMLYLFFSSDIWVIYINEESPSDKRALMTNLVLVGGVTGSILLPVFRSIFITDTTSYWRGMPIFAVILGLPLSVVIFLTLKETSKYKEAKINDANNVLKIDRNILFSNLRIIFNNKNRIQIISILIITLIVGFNYIFVALGEQFISSSPNLNQGDVNIIVLVMSIAVIFGYIFTGLVADKLGRKPLFYLYSVLIPFSLILVIVGSTLPAGALILVCLGAALANISYWGLGVVIRVVIIELVPTNVRGTASGLKSLISAFGITIGLLLSGLITFLFELSLAFIIISLLMVICIPLVFIFIKETKGTDLGTVK